MKKSMIVLCSINVILVLAIIGLVCIACVQKNKLDDFESQEASNGISDTSENSWYASIDEQYQLAFESAQSHVEMEAVCAEYSQIWLSYAEEYYDLVIESSPNIHKDSFMTMEEWMEYEKLLVAEYLAHLDISYQGGSIVPVLAYKYEYNLCRQRAIDLFNIYNDIIES